MSSSSSVIFELFTLSFLGNEWNYTTTNQEIIYGGRTYEPIVSSIGSITITDDYFKTKLKIKIDNKTSFVNMYIQGAPDAFVYAQVLRYDYTTDTAELFYTGEVLEVSVGKTMTSINCNQSNTEFAKSMMTNFYQKTCPHSLYDPLSCRLNAGHFSINGQVTALSGNKITISGVTSTDPAYYIGGQVIVGTEFKTISDYDTVTKEITVMNVFVFAEVGDQSVVSAGCDHTPETCLLKNNIENFGGEIYIPEKNPLEKL